MADNEHIGDTNHGQMLGKAQAGVLRKFGVLGIPGLSDKEAEQAREMLADLAADDSTALAQEILTDSVKLYHLTQDAHRFVHRYTTSVISYLEKVVEVGSPSNLCKLWRSRLTYLSLAREDIERALVLTEKTLDALGTPAPPEDER